MKRLVCLFLLTAAAFAQQPSSQRELAPPPPTPKHPVTNVYHGVKVVDDYQWLENSKSPEVRAWVKAENDRARAYLDANPDHDKIYNWLKALNHSTSPEYFGIQNVGGTLFALKFQPGKQQHFLITLKSANDTASEHVVVDPNQLDKTGATAIQFYVPSLDGKLVAVCLAEGGSEAGTVHVYEVATGKALADVVPRVNFPTAGGSVAWNADGSGFYYTRYPHPGERGPADLNFYQQIYFHKLGTATDKDTYVLGKDFPRIAEIGLETSEDGKYVLATVANGDGGQFEHFLRGTDGKWAQLTHFDDEVSAIGYGPGDTLYIVSRLGAPRGKMLRLSASTPDLSKAKQIIAEGGAVIEGFGFSLSGFHPDFAATHDRLYVVYVVGGPQEIRAFDPEGKALGVVPIEAVSSVSQLIRLDNGDLLFRNESYLKPGAWFTYHPQTAKTTETALRTVSPVSFDNVEAERETATSRDGTKVPLTVLHTKGIKLDGSHPTVLTGYGGFGISTTPYFDPELRMWLDAGGVYAVANIRGGGEFGEQWHQQGMLTHKQNVFDDFIACAEHLIQDKYTSPQKLGIEGGSNGGLLMGAVLTQRPDLFRAVVSIAGLYDMLRFETTQNGQFNVTEYGSVKNPKQFRALYAYSPYRNVKPGTKYPAVLLTVGENDLRVDPWHSRKFAAVLQADSTSGLPVLLLSFGNAGHGGIGASEDLRTEMSADWWTFFFDQLGAKFSSAPPSLHAAQGD
jgi:prolyl oligopeptidase